jgi:adenine phosphoribosyltransferase
MNINYKDYINDISDFPIEGIIYRDIQPLLADNIAFKSAINDMGQLVDEIPNYWVGIESRGFLFAAALSHQFGGGIRIIRKKGKLPNRSLFSVKYGLEYGSDELEMAHISTHDKGTCVIVDDVLATGGTIDAADRLCNLHGLEVKDKICFMDIGIYNGYDIKSIVQYVS